MHDRSINVEIEINFIDYVRAWVPSSIRALGPKGSLFRNMRHYLHPLIKIEHNKIHVNVFGSKHVYVFGNHFTKLGVNNFLDYIRDRIIF